MARTAGSGSAPRVSVPRRSSLAEKLDLRGAYGPTALRQRAVGNVKLNTSRRTGSRATAGRPGPGPTFSVPKINIQIPKIDPGKAIGDVFSHVAPQDMLFRVIGNRLRNPSRR